MKDKILLIKLSYLQLFINNNYILMFITFIFEFIVLFCLEFMFAFMQKELSLNIIVLIIKII